jgi:sugar phosphate permease
LYIIAIAFALGLSLYGSSPLFGIVATEIAPPGFERRSYAVIELATQVGCFLAGFPISFLIIAYKWRTTIWILEISVLLLAIVNIVSLTFHVRTKQVKVE